MDGGETWRTRFSQPQTAFAASSCTIALTGVGDCAVRFLHSASLGIGVVLFSETRQEPDVCLYCDQNV